MTDTLNTNSTANFAYLIDFWWGALSSSAYASAAHSAHYTSWDSPITAGSTTYGADPQTRMEVAAGKQTGIARDEPWLVTMAPLAPLTLLARPFAFSRVYCDLYEVDPTEETPAPVPVWSGVVSKVTPNPREALGCIKAEIAGWRAFLQYPASMESKTGCTNLLGDGRMCLANLAARQQTTTITSITAKTLVASGLTLPSDMPATYWTAGKITYDGLSIAIVDGSAVTSLKLLLAPPPEWVGVSAVFTPGCDRTYQICGEVWGQQARFNGLGIAAPSFNPIVGMR